MSQEQLQTLLCKAKSEPSLLESLQSTDSSEAVRTIARKNGFAITPEEYNKLSDDEPEGTSAGGC